VWEIADDDPQLLATLTAHDTQSGVQGVAFSPDGSQLVTGDLGVESIIVWDISPLGGAEWANATTAPFPPIPMTVSGGDEVVSISPSGDLAAFSMGDGTERSIAALPPESQMRIAADRTGAVIATAEVASEAPVQIWDASTGALLESVVVPGFDELVTGLSWSPDGEHLAISGGDGDSSGIVVVDRAGNVLASFREQPGVYLRNSSFSPDGSTLAIPRRPFRQAARPQQGLWIWKWRDEDVPLRLPTDAATANWDPSGTRIVVTSELKATAEIWDVAESRLAITIAGASVFNDARFSPDGSTVATAGDDGDVIIWSADEAAPIAYLEGHVTRVVSVEYGGDGRRLASFDADGSLRIWALDLDELIGIAERRLTRRLTDFECRQYLRRDTC
jgi:WD40 repeat protein